MLTGSSASARPASPGPSHPPSVAELPRLSPASPGFVRDP